LLELAGAIASQLWLGASFPDKLNKPLSTTLLTVGRRQRNPGGRRYRSRNAGSAAQWRRHAYLGVKIGAEQGQAATKAVGEQSQEAAQLARHATVQAQAANETARDVTAQAHEANKTAREATAEMQEANKRLGGNG